MTGLALNLVLVFVFFLIGGLFSAAEMALVTLRESQVKSLSNRGKRGRALAQLMANPNRFLSAVQIGVTLAGFLSASFGASTIGQNYLAPWLNRQFGWNLGLAGVVSTVVVTLLISYFSIVLSELTAKRLAMQRPEAFALALAPFINLIAKLARPIIWLLGVSTNAVVRILGGDPDAGKESVTDAELREMLANSASLGAEERHIVDEVFDAGDRNLREVMVPRTEVDFLPGEMPASKALREVKGSPRSRYPVTDGSPDRIVGFLHVRDLMDLDPGERNSPVRQLARPILQLPETVKILLALTRMRRENSHLAIVTDEYGGTAGIVTLEDLVEELIGDITDEYDVIDENVAHAKPSEIEGLTTIEEFGDQTGFALPEGPYDTVAGYFMNQLGEVPKVGDRIEVDLLPDSDDEDPADLVSSKVVMTVSEMDGRRIDWVSVVRADQIKPTRTPPLLAGADDINDLMAVADATTRSQLIRQVETPIGQAGREPAAE